MDLTYMNLEDALKTQTPSIVFLDMSSIQFDFQQEEAKCHKVLDQLPMTSSKLEYAFNTESEEMKPLDVLFPFFRYHSRWSDLGKNDFSQKYSVMRCVVSILRLMRRFLMRLCANTGKIIPVRTWWKQPT